MDPIHRSAKDVLVVTESLIEAANISEVITTIGRPRICLMRSAEAALPMFETRRFEPDLAVIAFLARGDPSAAMQALLRHLEDVSARVVLIDAPLGLRIDTDVRRISRPISAQELEAALI